MSEIRRYRERCDWEGFSRGMKECEDGEYVRYREHLAKIKELKAEVERITQHKCELENLVDRIVHEYEFDHDATMGSIYEWCKSYQKAKEELRL